MSQDYSKLSEHIFLPAVSNALPISPLRQDLLVSLSQLLRGTAYDKLKFAFKLYDVNGDGCITKAELTDIVSSVHELMGRSSHNRHVSRGFGELLVRCVGGRAWGGIVGVGGLMGDIVMEEQKEGEGGWMECLLGGCRVFLFFFFRQRR